MVWNVVFFKPDLKQSNRINKILFPVPPERWQIVLSEKYTTESGEARWYKLCNRKLVGGNRTICHILSTHLKNIDQTQKMCIPHTPSAVPDMKLQLWQTIEKPRHEMEFSWDNQFFYLEI